MKTLLVPTDFSEEAIDALKIAIDMAKTIDGKVVLLHVIDAPATDQFSAQGNGNGGSTLNDIFTLKLIERMRSNLDELAEPFDEDVLSTELALGDLYDEINKRVTSESVDLIIMGTKGAVGLQEVMVGSNAEKVVRRATCPVLTVKSGTTNSQPNHIVFASDFSEDYEKIAEKLKEFQQHYKAQLHLLFVNTPNKFEISAKTNRRIKAFADRYGIENYTINVYNHKDEEDGILGFAEEMEMDLIAVATHSKKGLAHLLSGSIAEGVANHSAKPVLSFSLRNMNS